MSWICLTTIEPEVILFQASRIAKSRPYCIAVFDVSATPMRYKRATSRNDLTYNHLLVRSMWGGSGRANGSSENYYALLLLKDPDTTLNWSKTYLNFESDVNPLQMSVLHTDFNKVCPPVVDFNHTIN